jgi:hypothetical protein
MRAPANVSRMIVDESTLNLLVVRWTSHVLTWFAWVSGIVLNIQREIMRYLRSCSRTLLLVLYESA